MPAYGSGAVVCSWSLLFAAIIAVVRQKFHLSTCSNLRSRLLEYRWGAPNSETMRRLAKELVGLKLDCIFTHTTVSSVAMQQETRDIPIVFVQVSDPVGSGLVASLSRPERNATGFTETGADT